MSPSSRGASVRSSIATLLVWFIAFASVSILTAAAPPAQAQGTRLSLIDQTPYVAADGAFGITLRWSGIQRPDLTVSARVFGAISTEAEVGEPPVTDTLNRYPGPEERFALATVADADGTFFFEIPIRSFEAADERVFIRDPGVYPVVIEVRDADGPVTSVQTHLIRLPTETAEIPSLLPTSVVINVSVADGIGLGEIVPLLERHPSLPVAVVLEEGVIPQLESDPELNRRFVEALGGRTASAVPVLNLDPSSIAEIGGDAFYETTLIETNRRLGDLGVSVDTTVLPVDATLTAAGAAMLDRLGIDIVINLDSSRDPGGAVEVGQGLRVLTIDEGRTSQLLPGPQAAQRANDLLASLAVRQQLDRSPIVLGGPELRSLDGSRGDTLALELILSALDQPGLIEAVDVATATGSGSAVPLRLVERPIQDLRPVQEQVEILVADLETYRAFYGNAGVEPDRLESGLLASLSPGLNPEERSRELTRLQSVLDDELDVISLPDGQSITITARTASVPIAIVNESLGPRTVMLRFVSDRIDVAEDGTELLLPPGRTNVDVELQTQALGQSPLRVEIMTPDGARVLSTTQYGVRSTAIPGLGYVLSLTALAFLIAWWLVSISKSRTMSSHPSAQGSTEGARVAGETGPLESDDPIVAEATDELTARRAQRKSS